MKLTDKTLSARVKGTVSDMIRKSEFTDKLSSEQGLAVQLGVSRNTIRKALKGLENEGLVISRHGISMFITCYNGSENIRYSISALDNTTKIILEHDYVPGTQSVSVDVHMASPEISKHLGSDTSMKILYIERARAINDTSIVFVEDYIPYVDGILGDFSSHAMLSLFQFINRYAPVSFANCSIHAVSGDKRQMGKLFLISLKALFLLQQIHYSSKGNSIFYFDSYFITEKLKLNLIRWRAEQTRMRGPG